MCRSGIHWDRFNSYFTFQPVLHDWCNKGCGMCYPVFGMVHIKEPLLLIIEREREMFYLTTHSTHFIYGYMASDIWLRTILIVRKETRCRHIGNSYRLTARVLLYAPSHRQDNTYHSLCYTSRGALAGTRMFFCFCFFHCYLPCANNIYNYFVYTVIQITSRFINVPLIPNRGR